jgi:hypothetical protein
MTIIGPMDTVWSRDLFFMLPLLQTWHGQNARRYPNGILRRLLVANANHYQLQRILFGESLFTVDETSNAHSTPNEE